MSIKLLVIASICVDVGGWFGLGLRVEGFFAAALALAARGFRAAVFFAAVFRVAAFFAVTFFAMLMLLSAYAGLFFYRDRGLGTGELGIRS
jgi:hypothetical protein